MLDSTKLNELAVDPIKFDENEGSSLNYWKTCEKEKLLMTSNFFFSKIVFSRLVLKTHKNQGLFWKGLNTERLKIKQ